MLQTLNKKTLGALPHSARAVTLLLNRRGVFYVADYGASLDDLRSRAKMRTWEDCSVQVVSLEEAERIANESLKQ